MSESTEYIIEARQSGHTEWFEADRIWLAGNAEQASDVWAVYESHRFPGCSFRVRISKEGN